jgi:DNA-binding beta-propeller fold protein YncE
MTIDKTTVFLAALMVCAVSALAAPEHPPNPYREVQNWAKLPEGRIWGHVFGVDVDSKGNVWALDRCGETSCVDSNLPPIMQFDSSGKFLKSFGEGLFVFPHSLYVDKDDNLWVTDSGIRNGKGNQVLKISPEGKVLLTLGKRGVLGGSPDNFVGPSDVAIGPNGDIFIADGHAALALGGGEFYGNAGAREGSRMRILKFSRDGTFIKAWGKEGTGPGEFNMPHGIALDSTGRVFVADRGNNRIQIFDQDGTFLDEWRQFGKPCGIFIDAKDILYVADSDSNKDLWDWKYSVDNPCATCVKPVRRPPDVGLDNPEFTQGIRIGSTKDGIVRAYLPPHMGPDGPTTLTERLCADADGNVYLADARTLNLRKYVKK